MKNEIKKQSTPTTQNTEPLKEESNILFTSSNNDSLLIAEIVELKKQLEQQIEINSEIEQENRILSEENAQMNGMISFYNEQFQQANTQLYIMSQSRSWRMTKPIRKLSAYARHNRFLSIIIRILRKIKRILTERQSKPSNTAPQVAEHCYQLTDFSSLYSFLSAMQRTNKTIYAADTLAEYLHSSAEKILLVSHEMSRTGAPIALMNMALCLREMGYLPIILSPTDGPLSAEINEQHIPLVILPEIKTTEHIVTFAKLFNAVVLNTIVCGDIADKLSGTDIPVLWWVHEAHTSYHEGNLRVLPDTVEDNIHIYCGGTYAQDVLQYYRPNYEANQLLYYVPDTVDTKNTSDFILHNVDGKIVFTLVGIQEERKGQDILADAIRLLPEHIREKCAFIFVGGHFYPPIARSIEQILADYPDNVQHIPQLTRNDLFALYNQADYMLCTSRDDPMPTVITEAMQLSMPMICSENTGSASLIEKMDCGLVYRNNSPAELAMCIIKFVEKKHIDFATMKDNARKSYETYFTKDVFKSDLESAFNHIRCPQENEVDCDARVSVVIPTFNAGDEIEPLLNILFSQQKISHVEVIVVDSGSKDNTPAIAEQLGAKVIQISQAEFSHSYARNLGASHASGDYILFMTQDAVPDSNQWIYNLLQPIIRKGVVAVSCTQTPKPDCDLLGRVQLWYHSDFLGLTNGDRIAKMPKQRDYVSLRRNAQLDDVTCLIRKDIFLQYGHRGNYAEDLDLGLRLITDGYKLGLLSSVQVIHSHTRPAFYHFKRALVDNISLKQIMPSMPVEVQPTHAFIHQILTAYCAIGLYNDALLKTHKNNITLDDFHAWSAKEFARIANRLNKLGPRNLEQYIEASNKYCDDGIKTFISDLYNIFKESYIPNLDAFHAISHFVTESVTSYYRIHEGSFTETHKQEICELIPKFFGQIAGTKLAYFALLYHDETAKKLDDMVQSYRVGV